MTKSERREAKRRKQKYGMRLDNSSVRRIQLALLQRRIDACKLVA